MAAMETVAHGHQAAAAAAVVSGQGSVAAASTALATVAATTSFVPSQLLVGMLTSGVSVSCANVITSPFDVLKVRLQLERAHLAEGIKSPGLIQTGINVVRNEGVLALWSGMGPSLACGLFIGGTRIGLYTPIKNAIAGEGKPVSLTSKILAGSLSGGMAVAIASPMELVKTRLQAAGEIPGAQTTTAAVIRAVIQTDGVLGLWKGAPAGTLRLALLTAAQCATYDEIKQSVMQQTGWCDGARAHFASALIAGLVTTTVSNPLDVVKARMFMGGAKYTSMLECTRAIIQNDGLMGFMKGWTASYARWAPATVVMFLTAEKLRKYVGLQSL